MKLVSWICNNLGVDIPFHILRFFPSYRYPGNEETPQQLLEELWQAARDSGMRYVYLGNAPGHKFEDTHCPNCGKIVIARLGFELTSMSLKGKRCAFCGTELNIEV